MSETFSIKLPQFEGPFDLLLFFIERDELDIYDIPISKITDDFLSYIHNMEVLNIELASEFILVAATLMRIKAKMLLPRKELNEEGKEIDPREELVARLIEYKKYKEVSEALRQMESERQSISKRGNAAIDTKEIASIFETDYEMESLSMLRLMKAFQNVLLRLQREKNKVVHTVEQPPYTIAGEKLVLIEKVQVGSQTDFVQIFEACENRIHAIFIFLSLLELVQEKILGITIGEGYNNFWLTKYTAEETAALNAPEAVEE